MVSLRLASTARVNNFARYYERGHRVSTRAGFERCAQRASLEVEAGSGRAYDIGDVFVRGERAQVARLNAIEEAEADGYRRSRVAYEIVNDRV